MAEVFGLDFGTTNTLAALVGAGEAIPLTDDEGRSHPSVIQYRGTERIVGKQAKLHLNEQQGDASDVVRSPKSFLGKGESIHVGGINREPREVVTDILRFVREEAQGHESNRTVESDFDEAVLTIPVNMDGRGRRELREAAADAGIRTWQFVHEPLAALYGYLRELPDWQRRITGLEGKLVLVFDWGGGTLDLTLCRIVGGTVVQVQNRGDNLVGGDLFDDRLRHLARRRHEEQHGLDGTAEPQVGAAAQLLDRCEIAKQSLSDATVASVLVPNYLAANSESAHLSVEFTREEIEGLCKDLVNQGLDNIDQLLSQAQVDEKAVEMVLTTGGMVQMPIIRRRLQERFGIDRVPVVDDGQQVIAKGAAWIAHDRRRLRLAKPFELLLADDTYISLFPEDADLPTRDKNASAEFGLYCVDPRDGFARFQFTRPQRPGRSQPSDQRLPYYTLLLPVTPTAQPVSERLNVQVRIDHDLVAHVKAESQLSGEADSAEIHGLEFGLSLSHVEN